MKMWPVGGLWLEYPIIVGAGVCKTPDSIDIYQHPDLAIGAVVNGSYTPLEREGNKAQPLSAWIPELNSGLNAYGMPNCGIERARDTLREKKLRRPLIVSIAGFSPEDYLKCLEALSPLRNLVAAVEFNFGCPNTHEHQTLPMSYDLDSLYKTLHTCRRHVLSQKSRRPFIWVKLSPYVSAEDAERLSKYVDVRGVPIMNEIQRTRLYTSLHHILRDVRPIVTAVVCCNTIPNCRYKNKDGTFVTAPNDGQAGLSGALLKDIALRQAKEIRHYVELLHHDVILSGGMLTGDDIADALEVADGVECTSLPYWHGGPKAFTTLLTSERLQQKLL